jgi:hypothetical protein
MSEENDYIDLKWGTLKAWKVTTPKGRELLTRYHEIGSSPSAMLQQDTPEQKEIICQLIDEVPGKICLDWEGKRVSKDEAKKYVREYGAALSGRNAE